jgi:hypothetical protein
MLSVLTAILDIILLIWVGLAVAIAGSWVIHQLTPEHKGRNDNERVRKPF